MSPEAETDADPREWALRLFRASPLKRRKFRKILSMMDNPEGKRSLDIGSDNGVISLLLRQRGGSWASADLIPDTVESIRGLVGDDVFQIDGRSTPFAEATFDQVIIVDFLEHIDTDREFLNELARILKPGGTLVVNVPSPREGFLRRIRFALGQTDEAHGHVRPGYTIDRLRELFGDDFAIQRVQSYSRVFSELIDTLITAALDLLKGSKRGKKGSVVRAGDLHKLKKIFLFYRFLAPFFGFLVLLDELFPFLHGNLLIMRAVRRERRAS